MTIGWADKTDESLARAYSSAAAGHYEATKKGDDKAAIREYELLAGAYRELRHRGPQALDVLVPLFTDANQGVRMWAAAHGLMFAPEAAERVLSELAAGRGIVALNAQMTLKEWRRGRLRFP